MHANKFFLLILTLLFGGFGVHRFYLGNYILGSLYLLFFWTGIPFLIALIEFIMFIFMSEAKINTYTAHRLTVYLVLIPISIIEGLMFLWTAEKTLAEASTAEIFSQLILIFFSLFLLVAFIDWVSSFRKKKQIAATDLYQPYAESQITGFYQPYAESQINVLYNLLFCDDITLFQEETRKDSPLLTEKPNYTTLTEIAQNIKEESRVRALAYSRLRTEGHSIPTKEVLGVIIEVPLKQGLDVLAAYSDGQVRYFNQSGKIAIFEGVPLQIGTLAQKLVKASQELVNQIELWEKKRLPPPSTDTRITFIVSDGLYFREGPFQALQQDELISPVIIIAIQLLQLVVKTGG